MNIIAQRLYSRIVYLSRNGYKMTPLVLETLLRSGQKNIVIAILNGDFSFEGDFKYLQQLLEEVIDKNELGQFIIKKANEKSNSNMKSRWQNLCASVPANQLAENKAWDVLVKQAKWDVLAKNGRFDDVINITQQNCCPKAAAVLEQNNLYDRIIELGRFHWLVYMAKGAELLMKHKQFRLLYENRKRLKVWTEEDVCKALLESPEGKDFLYREYPDVLLEHDRFDVFQKNGDWKLLAQKGYFRQIDWQRWRESVKKSHTAQWKQFLMYAQTAKRWDVLAEEKQWLLLLKNYQFRLVYNCWRNRKTTENVSKGTGCCEGPGHRGDSEI